MDRRAFIAAIPAVAIGSAASTAPMLKFPAETDPLVGWWERFDAARKEHIAACYKPGNGNFDTPEMLEIEDRKDGLEKLIRETPPVTNEGAAAKLRLIDLDTREGFLCEQSTETLTQVIEFLT